MVISSIVSPYLTCDFASPVMEDKVITYSPAFTLVPTYECFNHCNYCNFRVVPGEDSWLTLEAAAKKLELLPEGIQEILILSGEVAFGSPRRSPLINLIKDLCILAIERGFMPHTNAGPLSFEEMASLKEVNASMGLMLEQMNGELPVHRHAPSKNPELRLQQLEWAGQLKIPFTTGLLLGIGETEEDGVKTLEAIALVHNQYGHIQEVILQPHSPGESQGYEGLGFDPKRLPEVIRLARQILPKAIAIQVPPNLVADPEWLLDCIKAGVTDLGGIVPRDEVNPSYEHLKLDALEKFLSAHGYRLQPRLAVYPQYFSWVPPTVRKALGEEIFV